MELSLVAVLIAAFIILGILIYNATMDYGLPSFFAFMGIGLVLGNGYWGEPVYDNPILTGFLSNLSLNIIIFVGGYFTSMTSLRASYREGLVLSTVGVLLTALILGYFTHWVSGMGLVVALLFAAVVSSTDAAVVFGILQAKKLKLKHHSDKILEFESATNDPMALILVTVFLTYAVGDASQMNLIQNILFFLKLFAVGALSGLIFGWLGKWLLKNVNFHDQGLVPVLILSLFVLASYTSNFLGGNLLVASYIFGVMIGNVEHPAKANASFFNSSLSWLAQALMFFFLGLQINLSELPEYFTSSIGPAFILIFLARPLAVFISYLPFRSVPLSKKIFISFIGLKGATPIVFAFIPMVAGLEAGTEILYMVFFVVLFSILIQGTLLKPLSKKLNLIDEENI